MSFQIPPYVKQHEQIQLFHPNRPIGFPRRVLHLIHMASGSTFTNHLTSSNHVPLRGCFVEHEGLPIQLLRLGVLELVMRHGMPWSMELGVGIHRAHPWGPRNDFVEEDHISGILLGSVDATTSGWKFERAPCRNPGFSHGNVAISLKWKRRCFPVVPTFDPSELTVKHAPSTH